jgi:uncharacterized protein with von Willebrand factor type A (vWA) domain
MMDAAKYSPTDYLTMLDRFVINGDVFEFENSVQIDVPRAIYYDPILVYLQRLMQDPLIQSRVLGSRLAGKVFYEVVGRFVLECLHDLRFIHQMAIGEQTQMEKMMEWSMPKKQDTWQSLLQQLGEKYEEDEFDLPFMKRRFKHDGWKLPENWQRLKREWQGALDEKARKQVTKKVESKGGGIPGRFEQTLSRLENHVRSNDATEEQLLQAWEMMEGSWTESEFEKHLSIVQIENRYPEIGEVAKRMGRLPDEEGRARLTVQTGVTHRLEHSSGSDIEGVTIGRDLNALMPFELAQYADSALEGVFLRKYLTSRLQVFRYKSEISKPSRRPRSERAARRGPMIVCVDSSASMYGVPQRIEASLLSKLEETAERLHRDCFLIDFSVGIRPIELRSRRKKRSLERIGMRQDDVERFDKGYFPFLGGGTDAQKMLNLTFYLLDNGDDRYMNADVLWITDFLIPRTTEDLMERFKDYQATGTKFYGFKIGQGQSNWDKYFDKIYEVHYRQPRRY